MNNSNYNCAPSIEYYEVKEINRLNLDDCGFFNILSPPARDAFEQFLEDNNPTCGHWEIDASEEYFIEDIEFSGIKSVFLICLTNGRVNHIGDTIYFHQQNGRYFIKVGSLTNEISNIKFTYSL